MHYFASAITATTILINPYISTDARSFQVGTTFGSFYHVEDLGHEEVTELLNDKQFFLVTGDHQSGKSTVLKIASESVSRCFYITATGLNVRLFIFPKI